jgi:hypothetical protein
MIRSGREAGCGDTILLLLKVSISPHRIVFISLTLHLHIIFYVVSLVKSAKL